MGEAKNEFRHELRESEHGIWHVFCEKENRSIPLSRKPSFCPMCGKGFDDKENN